MKYIEKLLKGAEVKWMPLGEVLRRTKGTKITAGQMKAINKNDAPVKIFAGGKTIAFVDFEDIPEKDINREPSVIVKSGLMVKCTPERGQKCSLFHLMVKCTPIIVELPSVYRGCKPLICFQ